MKRTEQHVVTISHATECPNPGCVGRIVPPFRTVRTWMAVEVPDEQREAGA